MSLIKWLVENLDPYIMWIDKSKNIFEQAKEMEIKEKAKRQLFIGKVSEIIGAEKTIELLKEVNNDIKC